MKRVLITGANRGIGLELVRKFVDRGDRVFAGYRSLENSANLEGVAVQYPKKKLISSDSMSQIWRAL